MPVRRREIETATGLAAEIRAAEGPSRMIDMKVALAAAVLAAKPVGQTGRYGPPEYSADLMGTLAPKAFSADPAEVLGLFAELLPDAEIDSRSDGGGGFARVTTDGIRVEFRAANQALALLGAFFSSLRPDPDSTPDATIAETTSGRAP